MRPSITGYSPKGLYTLQQKLIYLDGANFDASTIVTFNAAALATTFIDSSRLSFVLPAALAVGTYVAYVNNAEGLKSNDLNIEVLSATSAFGASSRRIYDQRVQPLPAPLNKRTDYQRVKTAANFSGSLPDVAQGKFGDAAGPITGGRWTWNQDVVMSELDFTVDGVEPGVGRTSGSGFFIRRKNAFVDTLILDISGVAEHIVLLENITVHQGDELKLVTIAGTLEMVAGVTVALSDPFRR